MDANEFMVDVYLSYVQKQNLFRAIHEQQFQYGTFAFPRGEIYFPP